MLRKTGYLAAALILSMAPCVAMGAESANGAICGHLSEAIDLAQLNISDLAAHGVGDDSAPRATLRAAQATAYYAQIQVNLSLMVAHHCSPYGFAITEGAFLNDAAACEVAVLKAVTALKEAHIANVNGPDDLNKLPPECNRASWKRQ
jgi:hypothetical protein